MSALTRRGFLAGSTALPLVGAAKAAADYDVIVAGGGPAGIGAAVSAADAGARTLILESRGTLGGIWTGGLLSCIIGFGKTAIDREILDGLKQYGSYAPRRPVTPASWDANFLYEPEYMKVVLDAICARHKVDVRLLTSVVAAETAGRRLKAVVTESKSGRESWCAAAFVDATGDGDLAARAGCGFDVGDGRGGPDQPATLMALVTADDGDALKPFTVNEASNYDAHGEVPVSPKERLLAECRRVGAEPTYSAPTLFRLRRNLFALMADQHYAVRVDDAAAISRETVVARRDLVRLVSALADRGGAPWRGLRIVATADQVCHRGGRRIHGRYTVTAADVAAGRTFDDGVTTSAFPIDIHATSFAANLVAASGNPQNLRFHPFQIPLRACRAADVDNLYMGGRCLSGDFVAQASYRVTGTAVATGAAAGRAAALLAKGCRAVVAALACVFGLVLATPAVADEASVVSVTPSEGVAVARERVRALRRKGVKGVVRVKLTRGVHRLSEPLRLGAEDSDVEWTGEADGTVLSGGRTVPAGSGRPVTDPKVLSRLPERVRDRVRVWDLAELGFGDVGDRSRNYEHAIQHRVASVYNQGEAELDSFPPVSNDCSKGVLEMFSAGRPLTVAKSTWIYHIEKATGPTAIPNRFWTRHREPLFVYREEAPSRWTEEPDPWTIGYWSCDWGEQIQQVKSIDPEKKSMELCGPEHRWGYRDGQWFRSLNLLSELDEVGECVIDGQGMKAYALLANPDADGVEFSDCSRLVEICGASNVVFRSLTFEESRRSAVSVTGSVAVVIADSTIRNTGGYGVLVQDGFACGVTNCDIYGHAAGGVFLVDGNRASLVPSRHFVEDCRIHDFGRRNRMYRPAVWLVGVGQRAVRNLICNAPHAGLLFFGNDFEIAWNEFHDVCDASNDCGAIYTGRSWLLRGTRIHHNYFHDICGLDGGPCNTVYLDDSVAGIEVTDNVFERVPYGVFIAGARDVTVRGNVFIDCPGALRFDARGKNWQKSHLDGRVAEWKKSGTQHGIAFTQPPYVTRYPALATLMDTDVYAPLGNDISGNFFLKGDGRFLRTVGERKAAETPGKKRKWGFAAPFGAEDPEWYVGGTARDHKGHAYPYFKAQFHDNFIGK